MRTQKRLAGQLFKCSKNRIRFDTERLEDIKGAITKRDISSLIGEGAITKLPPRNTSRFHARKIHMQKKKGRRKGHGSRKGRSTARTPAKRSWINKIRLQRSFIKHLKVQEQIDNKIYYELYNKSKGGFFRSIRHLKLYIQERKLAKAKPAENQK